jgi:hypothetical protein
MSIQYMASPPGQGDINRVGTPARRNWQGQPPIQASAQWLHIQTQPKEGII